ncbi:MAG TPA: NapC/NirT family cytochrome c [Burkholderiaceae bacterium]|nr:NapC/NirT family cytochrome c [Burkholderiaceae bacterium]
MTRACRHGRRQARRQECRNCHGADYMDFTRQSPRAADMHARFLVTGEKTCIDCHKGIAHRLPNMSAPVIPP